MKKAFIFDLCAARCAATMKNEKDEEDTSSYRLLVEIIKNCNPIHAPEGYDSKYMAIWSGLHDRKEFLNENIFRLWKMAWGIQGKLNFGLAGIEEHCYHNDDEDIVNLACSIAKGVVLVTTDGRLMNKLVELGLPRKNGFEVMRPEDALGRVKEDV